MNFDFFHMDKEKVFVATECELPLSVRFFSVARIRKNMSICSANLSLNYVYNFEM